MKLPEIETSGVGTAPDLTGPYRSFAQMSETAAEGIKSVAQEVVRSQMQKATVDLARGLNKLEEEIEGQKFVSTKYVREKLGDRFDALPPEVRGQLTQQGLDLGTGEPVELDREDIPTFLVADTIFDVQAQRLLGQAARHVSVGGWASEFKSQAEMTVLQRKAKINDRQIKAMSAYFVEEDTNDALELANSGEFAAARQVATRSKFMDPAYKAKLNDEIDKVEQVRPISEALRNDDYAEMSALVGKLNDPKEFTKLTQPERLAYSDRLKHELKSFQKAIKDQNDRQMDEAAAAGWRTIFEKKMRGEVPSYKDIPESSTIKPDEQKQMLAYVDNLREGKDPKTNMSVYAMLSGLGDKLADYPIMRHVNELSPTDLKHFLDQKASLAGKGAAYDDFVKTEEAINQRLVSRGVNLKDDDEDVQAGIGSVKSSIQHELSALGRRATLAERDEIIERVLDEKAPIDDPWWRGPRVKFVNPEIPGRYEVAIRRVYTFLARTNPQLEQRITPKNIKSMWDDFSKYERQIADSWPFYARGRKLTPEDAILVYGVLKSSLSEIDAELNRVAQPLTPENRAAFAVQMFLKKR